MKTQMMHNQEDFELDNVYNDDERYYTKSDSSIWYN